MLAAAPAVVMVATADAAAARTFYRDVLGLPLRSEDDFALVFDLHGATLRVVNVEQFTPEPFTVLGWLVDHMPSAVQVLTVRGLKFERFEGMPQDQHGVWTAPSGGRVAWFKDPAGNTLSITQLATSEGA